MRLFSHVLVIFTVSRIRLATNSLNAILNNFEEYCMYVCMCAVPHGISGWNLKNVPVHNVVN